MRGPSGITSVPPLSPEHPLSQSIASATPPAAVPIADRVSLLGVDPELGAEIADGRFAEAERDLTVRVRRLAAGRWDVRPLADQGAGQIGLLLLTGVVWREVGIAGQFSAELLGPGDVLRPWQFEQREVLLDLEQAYTVLSPADVALLDRRLAVGALSRWPEVTERLFERLTERALRLSTTQAISQMTRVDRRINTLFWHLAERWGRVSGEGVVVPLELTHRMIGQLVGARRPTVSTALGELAERGELVRRRDGSWLLAGDPARAAA